MKDDGSIIEDGMNELYVYKVSSVTLCLLSLCLCVCVCVYLFSNCCWTLRLFTQEPSSSICVIKLIVGTSFIPLQQPHTLTSPPASLHTDLPAHQRLLFVFILTGVKNLKEVTKRVLQKFDNFFSVIVSVCQDYTQLTLTLTPFQRTEQLN